MKKILYILTITAVCSLFFACSDDEWGNGDPAMEHIYYFGFEDWGRNDNKITFDVKQGETISIPVQFHSERTRSYDVTTYYYVYGNLTHGVDYQVVDENGGNLQPDANGAFSVQWPKAVKGVKSIYIKGLNASTGEFTLATFNPNDGKIEHTNENINITNSKTNEYEVRAFTQNYFRVINVK